jgi:hypothetical protein
MPTFTSELVVALGLGAIACGGAAAPGPNGAPVTQPKITDVERFMPLVAGTVYSYETSAEGSPERGILVVAVDRPRDGLATLTVGGKVQRLEIVPEGIRLATGGWLLKAPLEAGAHFRGQFGDVTVKGVDESVQVPAGTYRGCVVTTEESVAGQKKVTTTFCRDVGMVLLDAEGTIGDDYGRERAALKSFGKRVDVNDMAEQR